MLFWPCHHSSHNSSMQLSAKHMAIIGKGRERYKMCINKKHTDTRLGKVLFHFSLCLVKQCKVFKGKKHYVYQGEIRPIGILYAYGDNKLPLCYSETLGSVLVPLTSYGGSQIEEEHRSNTCHKNHILMMVTSLSLCLQSPLVLLH